MAHPTQLKRELAEVGALGVALGDEPDPRVRAILAEFHFTNSRGHLTDAGWQAAGEAIGFTDHA